MIDIKLDFEPPRTVRLRLSTGNAADGRLDTRRDMSEVVEMTAMLKMFCEAYWPSLPWGDGDA